MRKISSQRELGRLAGLMQAVERVETATPDEAWVAALRARMIEADTPRPAFRRQLRRRLVGSGPRFPIRVGAAAATAVVVAAVVLVWALHPFSAEPNRVHTVANVPQPSAYDLLRGYPSYSGGAGAAGGFSPTYGIDDIGVGQRYPKRLKLTPPRFTRISHPLYVYRLSAPHLRGTDLQRQARRLGIHGPERCIGEGSPEHAKCGPESWRVVGSISSFVWPRHTIAISPTGELVYYDEPERIPVYHGPRYTAAEAERVARSWMIRVGWPGRRLPLLHPPRRTAPVKSAGLQLSFGWPGGITAAEPAARVTVMPQGTVTEADLWPFVLHREAVLAGDVTSAWARVAGGKTAIGVAGMEFWPPQFAPNGSGSTSKVRVVQMLVTPLKGPAYLEPAYKFYGIVHLAHHGSHHWFALVPAAQR